MAGSLVGEGKEKAVAAFSQVDLNIFATFTEHSETGTEAGPTGS